MANEQEVGELLTLEYSAPEAHVLSKWEVTAFEPPRSLALRAVDEGEAAVEVRWTLQGVRAGNTRVCVEADITSKSFFLLSRSDLEAVGTRRIQHDLAVLRQCLETCEDASQQ
jgi:hypothetical protein